MRLYSRICDRECVEEMEKKKLLIVGDIEVGGERGRVFSQKSPASSMTATDYKDPQKAMKRWKRKKS